MKPLRAASREPTHLLYISHIVLRPYCSGPPQPGLDLKEQLLLRLTSPIGDGLRHCSYALLLNYSSRSCQNPIFKHTQFIPSRVRKVNTSHVLL